MSVFTESCFLFLDNPRGGVENLADMKAAGFDGVFCNVIDYSPVDWGKVVRPRALELGMFCGPWGRTGHPPPQGSGFEQAKLEHITAVARTWNAPCIVNCEKEIDGSGKTITPKIATAVEGLDAAISMESILFADVDWTPVAHLPMLLQIFPAESTASKDPAGCKEVAHSRGVRCVYFTFGTYGGMKPADFDLTAPYSLFTGDAMGASYAPWSPTSTGFEACAEGAPDMEKIGKQHGITGFVNWLRSQSDVPPRGPNYDHENVDTWPWPDKIERTLTRLVEDHDAAV